MVAASADAYPTEFALRSEFIIHYVREEVPATHAVKYTMDLHQPLNQRQKQLRRTLREWLYNFESI